MLDVIIVFPKKIDSFKFIQSDQNHDSQGVFSGTLRSSFLWNKIKHKMGQNSVNFEANVPEIQKKNLKPVDLVIVSILGTSRPYGSLYLL